MVKGLTKVQQEVLRLHEQLHPLTAKERMWATKQMPTFIGHASYGKVTCMQCGTVFEHNGKDEQRCPHCKRKLQVEQTRRESASNTECFVLLDAVERWQVMRYFHVITESSKKGTSCKTRIREIMQRWVNTSGQYVIMSITRYFYMSYSYKWSYGTPFEVRKLPPTNYYNRIDHEGYSEVRIRRLHERMQHVGYDESKCKLSLFHYIRAFMSTPYAETLYKQGRYELFQYMAEHELFSEADTVAAVRIALRNKYDICKDVTMWFDYVQLLVRLKKDVHNAHYVCPKSLKKAHDEYLHKWQRIEAERQRRADEKRKLEKVLRAKIDNEAYIKRMKPFLGLLFTDGRGISLHVLRDVAEFAEEAAVMHHCVFDNEYYKKPTSLIMSAQVNGERTETVEVSLQSFTLQQSRGHNNYPTKYHKRIVSLVNRNMPLIKQAAGMLHG